MEIIRIWKIGYCLRKLMVMAFERNGVGTSFMRLTIKLILYYFMLNSSLPSFSHLPSFFHLPFYRNLLFNPGPDYYHPNYLPSIKSFPQWFTPIDSFYSQLIWPFVQSACCWRRSWALRLYVKGTSLFFIIVPCWGSEVLGWVCLLLTTGLVWL